MAKKSNKPILRIQEGYQLSKLVASGLTPRESHALLLRASGASYKDCAEQMNCSTAAVKARISNLFYKLDAINTPELIAKAFMSGHLKALSFIAAALLCLSGLVMADNKHYLAKHWRTRTRHELQVA